MRNWADKDEVLALLQSGEWELGHREGIREPGNYWMQKGGLGKGGETRAVRGGTVNALEKRGLIKSLPRSEGQPYWLRRYALYQSDSGGILD